MGRSTESLRRKSTAENMPRMRRRRRRRRMTSKDLCTETGKRREWVYHYWHFLVLPPPPPPFVLSESARRAPRSPETDDDWSVTVSFECLLLLYSLAASFSFYSILNPSRDAAHSHAMN